jgi:hypothetical protein
MENIYKPLMNCFDVSGCSRIVYYKPSNYQFAQQGGVSASSLITRIKYNAISTNTMKYRTSFGDSVANAMAYGVSDKIYTDKDKLGYSNTCTPIIGKDGTISSTQCYRSRR